MLTVNEAAQLLGINPYSFTEKELLIRYRSAAKKCHPDLRPNDEENTMYLVNEAHEILKKYLKGATEKFTTTESSSKKCDPYKEKIEEYGRKFDLSYSDAVYRYRAYTSRTGYTGSIIDYYEELTKKYYYNKEKIMSLVNEITIFYGSITYVIDKYEESSESSKMTIIEWLENKVSKKKLSERLDVEIKEIFYAYQNDQTYGYEKSFDEYVKELYDLINSINIDTISYSSIKRAYKRENNEDKKETFIDYLKIRLQIESLKQETELTSDDLLYKMFEILNANKTLDQTVSGIKEKVLKKS